MSQSIRVALVTGANRGIGLSICQQLAAGYAGPLVLYAATRSGAMPRIPKVENSVKVLPAQLSLIDMTSIESLTSKIRGEQGGCDVLINNAGVYYYREYLAAAERKETLETNYHGTIRLCQAFLPIMRPHGRIVNLSSQSGQLHYFSPHVRTRFLKPDLTLDHVNQLVDEYMYLATKGFEVQSGWPPLTYFTSKAALNAATRILARDNPQLLINCCCPGWVATTLGGQAGLPPKTSDEGARIPLRLAFGDIQNVSGRYWANDSVSSIDNGKVQSW